MIDLPALRGNDALGFLAAVGLVSLSEQNEIPPLRLAWRGGAAPLAAVEGPVSLDSLAVDLGLAFQRLRAASGVIPGVPAWLPLSPKGTKDPMRTTRDEVARLFRDADDDWRVRDSPWFPRWLLALSGQAALDRSGRVTLTPFYAPTGQMKMRTSIFEFTMDGVERVGGPADALTHWRRCSYDGANFDERAKRDAAVTTTGQPDNRGAPSPTWLAAMAMRLFPVVDNGTRIETVGWQRVALYPGYTRRSLVWPVWKDALDSTAVRTLLAHPAMKVVQAAGYDVAVERTSDLRALGVAAVYGASRRTQAQGDGPIGPARRIWAAPLAP